MSSYVVESGATYDMETLIIFRRAHHVMIYRTIEELQTMLAHTYAGRRSLESMEIEFITTAVEQRRGDPS